VLILGTSSIAAVAQSDGGLVAKGTTGQLKVSVLVEGTAEKSLGGKGEMVKWTTRRSFEAVVPVVAGEQQAISAAAQPGLAASMAQKPSGEMAELQKQMQACPKNDTTCQMQLAMKMMNTSQMQEQLKTAEELEKAPRSYQVWAADPKGPAATVEASYNEQWHTVFYTAARETTDCTLKAPAISPALAGLDSGNKIDWVEMNRKALQFDAKSLAVEVDARTGASRLRLVLPGNVYGELRCVQDIGGSRNETSDSNPVTFQPPIELDSAGWLGGGTSAGAIATGMLEFDVQQPLANLRAGFAVDVQAPLHVTLHWQLN
jgi:hypothetical protein